MKIINKMFKSIIQWFLYSSANPQNFSLTLKALIPFLVLFNVGDATSLGEVADTVVNALVLTGAWVAGVIAAYGAIRKVTLTTINALKR